MQLFNFYHQHYNRLAKSDFWLYEVSVWLHTLARSFISIFIPILMLQAGYEIKDVVIYYVVYNAIDVPLNFGAGRLVSAIGARWVIVIGSIASILFFLNLSLIDQGWSWFLLLALWGAIYDTFYWVAHRFLFIEANDGEGDVGRNTGILYSVRRLAGLLGPAAGAAILIFSNQYSLIAASSIIFAMSIVPLLYAGHLKDKPSKPMLSFKEFFKDPKEKRNYISTALFGIHSEAESVLWPLFIFITFETLESVALVPMIVSMSAIIFSYFTGKAEEKHRKSNMMALGAVVIASTWVLRLIWPSTNFYYASIFIVGMFSILVAIPLSTRIFDRGLSIDPLTASTYQNASSMFARLVLYAILAITLNVFGLSFSLAAACLIVLIAINNLIFGRLIKASEKAYL